MAVDGLKTCYTCCGSVTTLTDLLEKDADDITYISKLSRLLQNEFIRLDSMGICEDCITQLRACYKFLETVTISQASWKDCTEEIIIQIEESATDNAHEIGENARERKTNTVDNEPDSPHSDCVNDDDIPSRSQSDHEEESNQDKFKCAQCSEEFPIENFPFHGCFRSVKKNKQTSRRFEQVETITGFYQCSFCEKSFRTKSGLKKHTINIHDSKDCVKIIIQNSSHNDQMTSDDVHHDSNSEDDTNDNCFKCANCLKEFPAEQFLQHNCFKPSRNVKKSVGNTRKESNSEDDTNDNCFKCANCLKEFPAEQFLQHDCFKSSRNVEKSVGNARKESNLNKTSKRGMSYKCRFCKKSFDEKWKLEKHMTSFHNIEAKDKNFEKKSSCNSNVNDDQDTDYDESNNDNIFECAKCLKMFSDIKLLMHDCFKGKKQSKSNENISNSKNTQRNKGIRRKACNENNENISEESDKSIKFKKKIFHECHICKKIFEKKWRLHTHMVGVHNEDNKYKYKCSICAKTFKKSLHVKEHMTLHTGEKNFSCDLCGKKFRLLSSQQRHTKSHYAPPGQKTKKTPFLCTICGRNFPYSNSYQRHMRVHLGIRNHECKICYRKFQISTHLKVHMRTHTGEKPYICDACGEAFSLKASLDKHISKIHGEQSPHFNSMCSFCGENFAKFADLNKHISKSHGEQPSHFNFMCSFCGENFAKYADLQYHKDSVHNDCEDTKYFDSEELGDYLILPKKIEKPFC